MKSLRELRDEYTQLDSMRVQRDRKDATEREKREQSAARIAALSCFVTLDVVEVGIINTVRFICYRLYSGDNFSKQLERLKPKHKSRYEYNQERKRDFRMNKPPNNFAAKVKIA